MGDKKVKMTGWKTKGGFFGAAATGIGMVITGVKTSDWYMVFAGLAIFFGAFELLGAAHKIEKNGK
jgi:hypothetical protein